VSIGTLSYICKISIKTFSYENKNFCNDFKELHRKIEIKMETYKEYDFLGSGFSAVV
jgi:hypothetical protein